MGRAFTGVYAPSTLGSFLRSFTFAHVRKLDAVASRFVIRLANGRRTSVPHTAAAERIGRLRSRSRRLVTDALRTTRRLGGTGRVRGGGLGVLREPSDRCRRQGRGRRSRSRSGWILR
jgi:hypothetical protein